MLKVAPPLRMATVLWSELVPQLLLEVNPIVESGCLKQREATFCSIHVRVISTGRYYIETMLHNAVYVRMTYSQAVLFSWVSNLVVLTCPLSPKTVLYMWRLLVYLLKHFTIATTPGRDPHLYSSSSGTWREIKYIT